MMVKSEERDYEDDRSEGPYYAGPGWTGMRRWYKEWLDKKFARFREDNDE